MAEATALSRRPGAVARALTVVVVVMAMARVQAGVAAVGAVPSVVAWMAAPAVAQVRVTSSGAV